METDGDLLAAKGVDDVGELAEVREEHAGEIAKQRCWVGDVAGEEDEEIAASNGI